MTEYRDDRIWCCSHPGELVVGVCALCLNERLLVLASKQSHLHQTNTIYSVTPKRVLQKIFALTSLLSWLDNKQQKSEVCHSSSTSPEESFISIKFEDNGVASWSKEKNSKMPNDEQCEMSAHGGRDEAKKTVEHTKPRGMLRWQKRISQLFQLNRRKRSSKDNIPQVGTKLEGGKVKYGWIRTLAKRTKE